MVDINLNEANNIYHQQKINDKEDWSLEEGIKIVENVVRLFFSNKYVFLYSTSISLCSALSMIHQSYSIHSRFREAKEVCQSHADKSIYHSLCLSYINFVYGVFTMESDLINEAVSSINISLEMVQRMMKTNSITKSLSSFFFKKNYNEYTDGNVLTLFLVVGPLL